MVSEKTAYNYLNAGLFDADITQHFRCQTENFQGCDLPLQKSKRQSDLWEFFAFFPISCLMLLILTHSTPLKKEFPHICKSESKFLNFAVAFTLTNLHLLSQTARSVVKQTGCFVGRSRTAVSGGRCVLSPPDCFVA